jgi:hypothetical protein
MRHTVGDAVGFEKRRKGKRYKLSLPVQLKNRAGITRDISAHRGFSLRPRAHIRLET